MQVSEDILEPEGSWEHIHVSAHGAQFHVATQGEGPLLLFLHGFPTHWWTWRHFFSPLVEAGYQVAAMDLRGYGTSDHTPRGYDPFTTSSDISGVIRSMGHLDATIIGHGWGGFLAWTAAAFHPDTVKAIVPISMAHPHRLRDAIVHDRTQLKASSYVIGFQRPWVPERQLVADDAAAIGGFLRDWSGDQSWLTEDVSDHYRQAFQHSNTAHCALEYHRWALRSIPRADGRRFLRAMTDNPLRQPVLHLHGELDRTVLPRTAIGSQAYVTGPYAWRLLRGVGHFVHEENPQATATLLVDWLTGGCAWQDSDSADPMTLYDVP